MPMRYGLTGLRFLEPGGLLEAVRERNVLTLKSSQ
jgi:hypothetical protein